jgi:putative amino-acid transport system substrate-binding protein
MKKTASFACVGLLAMAALVGCNDDTKTAVDTTPVLRIGTTGQSYPGSFKENDKLVGFDVDVVREIAKDLHYKVEFVTSDFSGLMGQLESGKIDTIANDVAVTEVRKKKYNYSNPYAVYSSQIVTNKANTNINTWDDLKGKVVAGVLGSNHINNLKKTFPDGSIEIRTYESRDGAINDVINNRVAGYVNSAPILMAQMNKKNMPFKFVDKPLVVEQVAFPFAKTSKDDALREKINGALDQLRKDGRLTKLSIQYFGDDITQQKQS